MDNSQTIITLRRKNVMKRKNCWEFKNCGRESGGFNTGRLGVCPATTCTALTGFNHGECGGRSCWAIAGTLCKGNVQGTYAKKIKDCLKCDFYEIAKTEEGVDYQDSAKILKKMRADQLMH
jgi:hypothetical protein